MKLLLIGFIAMCVGVTAKANEVKLKIANQYGAKLEGLTLTINGVSKILETEKDGTVQFMIPNSDSFSLAAKNCTPKFFATKKLTDKKILDEGIALNKKFTWKDLINPMFYIIYGGLWLLLFIIFAETGLFAGFFLPGDSLLFVAGIYSKPLANEFLKLFGLQNSGAFIQLTVLITLITIAGILGNFVGYAFGRWVGPTMFNWRERFLFKKKYLIQAQEFYDNNGGGAIIAARFIPIVRTFAPIIAGIVKMTKAKFTFFNIVGCIAWVTSMILIGHFLDQFFPTLKDHLELIVIGIVLVTTAPVLFKLFFGKKEKKAA
jgi:membrane-associated protein